MFCGDILAYVQGFILGTKGSYSPVVRIPDPDARVQTTRGDAYAVKYNGVDLAEVALQCSEALAGRDTPYLSGCVVAAGDDQITMDL